MVQSAAYFHKMNFDQVIKELEFRTSKSGGPGGQHANKSETKVELIFNVIHSKGLSESEKKNLFSSLKNKISVDGFIRLTNSDSRSQIKNKQHCIDLLYKLLKEGIIPPKKRVPTSTPRKVIEKRIEHKKRKSITKSRRKKIDPNDY